MIMEREKEFKKSFRKILTRMMKMKNKDKEIRSLKRSKTSCHGKLLMVFLKPFKKTWK
jgi:hypothetical protein